MLAARVRVVFPFAGPWKGNAKCNVVVWNRNWTPDAEKSEVRNATSTSTVPGACLGAMHSSRVLETTVAATVVMLNRQRQGCRTTDMKFCQSAEQTRYPRIEMGLVRGCSHLSRDFCRSPTSCWSLVGLQHRDREFFMIGKFRHPEASLMIDR